MRQYTRAVWSEWLAVAILIVAITAFYTFPLCLHPATYVIGRGDPFFDISVSWWTSTKILSGHWAGMWSVPPIWYPSANPRVFGEPQFGTTIIGLAAFAATRNIVLAYNTVVLIALPLSALGTYMLVRHLSGNRTAAMLGAIAWGFGAWHGSEAGHQQLLSLECLPFILLALHRYGETRRSVYLLSLFAAWTTQEFLSEYWGAFLVLLIVPFAVVLLAVTYRARMRHIAAMLATIGAAIVPWMVVNRPLLANASHGGRWPRADVVNYCADLSNYLPAYTTRALTHVGLTAPHQAILSPGLIVLALAAVSLVALFRIERAPDATIKSDARWVRMSRIGPYGVAALGLYWMMLFAFGMEVLPLPGSDTLFIPAWMFGAMTSASAFCWFNRGIRAAWARHHPRFVGTRSPLLPYAGLAMLSIVWSCGYTVDLFGSTIAPGIHPLFTRFPGISSFRCLNRMGYFADLPLVVMAACSLAVASRFLDRFHPTRALSAALPAACLLAAIAENVILGSAGFRTAGPFIPAPRAADLWMAKQADGAAIDLPLTICPYHEAAALWHQVTHHHPIVNGIGTYFPRGYRQNCQVLADPSSRGAIDKMRSLGIRYVILDTSNPFVGQYSGLGPVTRMPATLPPPFVLCYSDREVKVYDLPTPHTAMLHRSARRSPR